MPRLEDAKIGFADRLEADALRRLAGDGGGRPFGSDERALSRLRPLKRGDEAKIVLLAKLSREAPVVARYLGQGRRLFRIFALIVALGAAVTGAITARTAFAVTGGTLVNIYWVLGSLLLIHVLTLALWLLSFLIRPKTGGGGVLGELVLWGWRQMMRRLGAGREAAASFAAMAAVYGGAGGAKGLSRWTLSTLSHMIWTVYLSGALLMILALLSTQHFVFVWETTILSADVYIRLTEALAAPPAALGFPIPPAAAIRASEWTGAAAHAAGEGAAWSGFLLGALIVYGLLPRLICLAASLAFLARAKARYRLNLRLPAFVEALGWLSPMHGRGEVVDADREGVSGPPPGDWPALPLPPHHGGPIALLGLEIDRPAQGWPLLDGGRAADFGLLDGKAAVEAAAADIKALRPHWLLVAVSALNTPDRGVMAQLKTLHDAAACPLILALTGQAALEARLGSDDAARRLGDWRGALAQAGLEPGWLRVIDLDRAGARAVLEKLIAEGGA